MDTADHHAPRPYTAYRRRSQGRPNFDTRQGYDGRIMSGWASMGQTLEESEKTMASLIESEGLAYVNG